MPPTSPLRGIRIHLAGSIRDDSPYKKEIADFVEKFALAVFREGGTLVHGSHPTFWEPLKRAATTFGESGNPREVLILARAPKYGSNVEEIKEQREYATVEIIPRTETPEEAAGSVRPELLSMRTWMAERSDVVVAIGGKHYDVSKPAAGTIDELEGALARGRPGFLVTAFGGAVADYSEDHPGVYERLRNGLSPESNLALGEEKDPAKLVASIIRQITLLPLHREHSKDGKLFRILALDGGGLRGAFTAAVLAKWVEMLGKDHPNPFAKFDMIAGTSTGSILAIGLGLGLTPQELLNFYRTHACTIFPKKGIFSQLLGAKHDSKVLKEILKSVFKDRKLSESSHTLVIPTVRAVHGEAEVIVTPHHHKARTAFRDISAVDAALASSAAPTYLSQAFVAGEISKQSYLDGGVWANNPVLPAIAEAVRYMNVPLDRIDVLSVGTFGNRTDFRKALDGGIADWAPKSADLFFSSQESGAASLADSFLSPARHLRVDRLASEAIRLDDCEAVGPMVDEGEIVGSNYFKLVLSRFF